MTASGVVNQIEHICREAKAISELFDKDTNINQNQAAIRELTKIHIDDLG